MTHQAPKTAQMPTVTEVGQLRSTNIQLRRDLEKLKKETSAQKTQLDATQNQLRQSELARATCEEYARKLESRLEKSGKGVALLKASRIQSDLEFLEKENNVLYGDLKAKDSEIAQLQHELQHQQALVDQAARNIGLPSRQLLEELYDLRQQAMQMNELIGNKEELLRRQTADLQDFDVYKNDYKRVQLRCEEMEVELKRAEEDKGTLLDYVEDLRRHKERDQGLIDELTEARDESKQHSAALEGKRRELEQLLKEQLQVLQASKQQIDVLEVQLAQQRAACAELTRERNDALQQSQALQRQHAVLEVELAGMQDQMRGVLDLNRAQQVDLNSRVDGLTHRITAAMGTPAVVPAVPRTGQPEAPGTTLKGAAAAAAVTQAAGKAAGAKGSGRASSPGRSSIVPAAAAAAAPVGLPGALVTALSRVSRQQEALVEQHILLKQEVRRTAEINQANEQLKAKVSKMETELHQLLADKMDLEAKVRENSAAWTQLYSGLSPKDGGTAVHTHIPCRENELVKRMLGELTQARSSIDILEQKNMAQSRERDTLVRTVDSLKGSLDDARMAMSSLPQVSDMKSAQSRAEHLEAMNNDLRSHVTRIGERHAAEMQALEEEAQRCKEAQEDTLRQLASIQQTLRQREEEVELLMARIALLEAARRSPIPNQALKVSRSELLAAHGLLSDTDVRPLAHQRDQLKAMREAGRSPRASPRVSWMGKPYTSYDDDGGDKDKETGHGYTPRAAGEGEARRHRPNLGAVNDLIKGMAEKMVRSSIAGQQPSHLIKAKVEGLGISQQAPRSALKGGGRAGSAVVRRSVPLFPPTPPSSDEEIIAQESRRRLAFQMSKGARTSSSSDEAVIHTIRKAAKDAVSQLPAEKGRSKQGGVKSPGQAAASASSLRRVPSSSRASSPSVANKAVNAHLKALSEHYRTLRQRGGI
ncbi:hypothetical protein CEUSTIGMA_g2589.t1 [Chlamydomonas eustigma]|uniref:Uncharacterized protein n=1 Tax=Chlamydomonas eustigma TaxID=1157962 RepID=A0A250WWH4_9CHLO|nr:hypothetical protein CEUSTIGMA_g2589.t1 [Chlamydomonas eustigma]|eukprot:GAX75145.1 hypothetical protein CEUSTIGMA_g2589.t1 [Chlamydomonas eustigma]